MENLIKELRNTKNKENELSEPNSKNIKKIIDQKIYEKFSQNIQKNIQNQQNFLNENKKIINNFDEIKLNKNNNLNENKEDDNVFYNNDENENSFNDYTPKKGGTISNFYQKINNNYFLNTIPEKGTLEFKALQANENVTDEEVNLTKFIYVKDLFDGGITYIVNQYAEDKKLDFREIFEKFIEKYNDSFDAEEFVQKKMNSLLDNKL